MNTIDVQREILKLAQLAGLSSQMGDIIASLALMPPDMAASEARHLLEYLAPLAQARAEQEGIEPDPFMPYPEPEEFAEGELLIGELLGEDVHMPLSDLLTHMLIAGPTGEGKSTFLTELLRQIIAEGVAVHVFDTTGEYADKLPGLSPAVSVLSFEDLRRNPFDGPEMSQKTWLYYMSDYMREAFFFRDGAINLFRDTAGRVTDAGKPLNAATFSAQFQKTSLTTRRIQDYFETLKRFVYALELPTYQCAEGYDLADLAEQSLVFDISQMPADLRGFFIADLVTWHSAARKYQRHRGIELVLVFDEMSKFVNTEATRRADFGDPFILDMLKRSRKKGMPVILADQTYVQFHASVRSNCLTKIIFQTQDGPSKWEISKDLSLDQDQRDYLSQMSVDRRRALVQLRAHPAPVLLDVWDIAEPPEAVPQLITPDDLAWRPIEKFAPKQVAPELTHDLIHYLSLVASNPFITEIERDRKFGYNPAKGSRLRQDLKEQGLVEEHRIPTGRKGGQPKILWPTDAGFALLDSRMVAYEVPPGDGGPTHKCMQDWVSRWLEKKGWVAKIEATLTDRKKRVDVGGFNKKTGETVAYEMVCEGIEKEVSNYEKDIGDGWQRVVFVVGSLEAGESLSTKLPNHATAEVKLLREFL